MTTGNGIITRIAGCFAALLITACAGSFGETATGDCGENDFVCGSGECVAAASVCNGRDNCDDGSDEANCVLKCENRSDYRCKDGTTCLPAVEVCDGRPDCPGADDESTCSTTECEGFQCRDSTCIDPEKKCDGSADCLLAEDEAPAICSPTRCDDDEFRCADGQTCLPAEQLCDEKEQCPQGDDEAADNCPDSSAGDGDGEGEGKGEGDGDGEGRPGGGGTPGKPGENNPDEDRPCTSIDEKGLCDGSVLSWCDNGQVEKRDCAREGKTCAQLDPAHGYTCISANDTPEPDCNGVSKAGSCNVDLLTFCSRGQVRTVDCSRRGQTCVPEGERFRCGGVAAGGAPDACNGLTAEGTCDGDTLRFCNQGEPDQYDCAASGMACQADGTGATCKESACGDVTYEGECTGATLRYCLDDARLVEVDCAGDYGLECGFLDDDIGFVCMAPESGETCGDLTYEGTCDGDTVRWCENGQPNEIDCGQSGFSCGDFDLDGDTVKACVDDSTGGGCGSITFEGECQGDTVVWCSGGELETKSCADEGKACGLVNASVGYWCVDAPPTSCEGSCGELYGSDGQCHCDISCTDLGDCCDDYESICE